MLSSLKYRLEWLKIINSPFKFPKVLFYFGKIRVGTPFFLPRIWKKNPDTGNMKAVPARWFKLDLVALGYKTKWRETDYRHEWDAMVSLVFCGLQIAIRFHLHTCIWESWLLYNHFRNLGMSKEDSLASAREINPNVWTSDGVKTDYFLRGLKNKYKDAFTD